MGGRKRQRLAAKNTKTIAEDDVADSSDHEMESDIDDGDQRAVRLMI